MRALHALILFGVSLLLGFTFHDDVPGKRAESPLLRSGAEVRADPIRDAYQAAQHRVQARVGTHRPAEFPSRGVYRSHVRLQDDGTYVINSWVKAQEATWMHVKTPWTARVRCTAEGCRVLDYKLLR